MHYRRADNLPALADAARVPADLVDNKKEAPEGASFFMADYLSVNDRGPVVVPEPMFCNPVITPEADRPVTMPSTNPIEGNRSHPPRPPTTAETAISAAVR